MQRNAQIYERHLQGVTEDELAKQFKLSEKRIQWIIREQRQKLQPHSKSRIQWLRNDRSPIRKDLFLLSGRFGFSTS